MMFWLAHHFLPREHEVIAWVELCLKLLHIHSLIGHMIHNANRAVLTSMGWNIYRREAYRQTFFSLFSSSFLSYLHSLHTVGASLELVGGELRLLWQQ